MADQWVNKSSQDNLEIVSRLYSSFARHDMDSVMALLHPDVEWAEPVNPFNPAGGSRKGLKGFLEWLRIGRETEDILAIEPKKFLTDHDSVAVVGYTKCLAKPTGRTYETDFVHLITFREGKVVRFQEFFDTYIAGEAFRPA